MRDARRRKGLLRAALAAVTGPDPDWGAARLFVGIAYGVGGPASPWAPLLGPPLAELVPLLRRAEDDCAALDGAWREERSRRWKEWSEAGAMLGGRRLFAWLRALRRLRRRTPT